jgi:hypothetical protein
MLPILEKNFWTRTSALRNPNVGRQAAIAARVISSKLHQSSVVATPNEVVRGIANTR